MLFRVFRLRKGDAAPGRNAVFIEGVYPDPVFATPDQRADATGAGGKDHAAVIQLVRTGAEQDVIAQGFGLAFNGHVHVQITGADGHEGRRRGLFPVAQAKDPQAGHAGLLRVRHRHVGQPQEAQPDHDGNYIVVVTNKLDATPVKIVKVDQEGQPLGNAEFTLSGGAINEEGLVSKTTNGLIYENDELHVGTYTLTETKAPAGYNSLEGPATIKVEAGQTGIVVSGTIAGEPIDQSYITKDTDTGVWTVKIRNTAGVELPHTGGMGTTFLYVLGAMMILISGSALIRRRIIT